MVAGTMDATPVRDATGLSFRHLVVQDAVRPDGEKGHLCVAHHPWGTDSDADSLPEYSVAETTERWPREGRDEGGNLSEDDLRNLHSVLRYRISENTRVNYQGQWKRFLRWAESRNVEALPAEPVQVAAYLAERANRDGNKPATLHTAASAIAFVHRASGLENPCGGPEVRKTISGATRKSGKSQKQAEGLTAGALEAIRATALRPKRGRGGRMERLETARRRGNKDIAMISLMRDALLRVSEAGALRWKDLRSEEDGTGRLLIRRSKTDGVGEGSVAFVSALTMKSLRPLRDGTSDEDSIFALRSRQISTRIKQAAQMAGLGEGFSGHSPRVGMARDLARAGTELPRLMTAGRWRSPRMPAHYTRNETVARGAVAQYYSGLDTLPPIRNAGVDRMSGFDEVTDHPPNRPVDMAAISDVAERESGLDRGERCEHNSSRHSTFVSLLSDSVHAEQQH